MSQCSMAGSPDFQQRRTTSPSTLHESPASRVEIFDLDADFVDFSKRFAGALDLLFKL